MSGMKLHIPLLDYKSSNDPPKICPPLPHCPRVPLMTTFEELLILWEHCQTALGIKLTREYPILSCNLTLCMSQFILHDASNTAPYVNRDPIGSHHDPIMINWDLCGSSNCLDLCPLTLLKDDCLTFFSLKLCISLMAFIGKEQRKRKGQCLLKRDRII